jgi:hypothetical protein
VTAVDETPEQQYAPQTLITLQTRASARSCGGIAVDTQLPGSMQTGIYRSLIPRMLCIPE